MIRVLIESPYAGDTAEAIAKNVEYARRCVKDCLKRGEAAYASHLFYTQPGILDDKIPEERKLGINAGLLWGEAAEKTAVYTDLGMTDGMKYGIDRAKKAGRPVVMRTLSDTISESSN